MIEVNRLPGGQESIQLLADAAFSDDGGQNTRIVLHTFIAQYRHYYVKEHGAGSEQREALRIQCTEATRQFIADAAVRVQEMLKEKLH